MRAANKNGRCKGAVLLVISVIEYVVTGMDLRLVGDIGNCTIYIYLLILQNFNHRSCNIYEYFWNASRHFEFISSTRRNWHNGWNEDRQSVSFQTYTISVCMSKIDPFFYIDKRGSISLIHTVNCRNNSEQKTTSITKVLSAYNCFISR